jgi:hypothetical protein
MMKTVNGVFVIQPTFTMRDRYVFDTIVDGLILRFDEAITDSAERDFLQRVLNASSELPLEPPDKHILYDEAEAASSDFPLNPHEARLAVGAINKRSNARTVARYTPGDPLYLLHDPQGWMGSAALPMFERYVKRYA